MTSRSVHVSHSGAGLADIGRGGANKTGKSVETRIGERITPQPNGCWLFDTGPDKYGQAVLAGSQMGSVHRFVYETLVGPIPDGYHVHHLCETPGCCNPSHLEPMSPGDHRRRHAEHRKPA